jgi:hypothetical protein
VEVGPGDGVAFGQDFQKGVLVLKLPSQTRCAQLLLCSMPGSEPLLHLWCLHLYLHLHLHLHLVCLYLYLCLHVHLYLHQDLAAAPPEGGSAYMCGMCGMYGVHQAPLRPRSNLFKHTYGSTLIVHLK